MSNFFPIDKDFEITDDTRPLTQTGTIKVYIQLAEKNLFVQGFEPQEYQERPPALLRGSLVLRVLKTSKIKSISLTLKGNARTEWPEGIPPKKQDYYEENSLINHTWPFYTHSSDNNSSGADFHKSPDDSTITHSHSSLNAISDLGFSIDDNSSINLSDNGSIKSSSNNALSILKRTTSPSPSGTRHRSNSLLSSFNLPVIGNNNNNQQSSAIDLTNSNTNDPSQHFVFQPGDYYYNFEHPIPSSTPETINAAFGSVSYQLAVMIERIGAFKSNIASTLPIKIIRTKSDESVEDSEPIAISRDWEDQLHYDIIVASKSMILNAYLPMAFKIVPLDKLKLHRIRVFITENIEYWCKNKKVHRMEPTKKILLLEHKAPPPPDLPADADAKAKKMGNLLTSDGYDITAKEFEFQVYIPRKVNNRQTLHPNTSYSNIKSHHWIKICLRLSRIIDGKPKHYEISIDSPIHVLDPLCSHANTLLPAYGIPQFDSANQNHESNIYFPKNIVNSPPLSPQAEPVLEFINNNNQNSIQIALETSMGKRRTSSTSSNIFPTFETSLSANVYKPTNLDNGLTSPQAVPVSPANSPPPRPIHLIRRPSYDPPAFDADISPPPVMRDLSPNVERLSHTETDILSFNNHGGIGFAYGIDSMMNDVPRDPPTYDDYLKEESRSNILDNDPPDISISRSSESPKPNDINDGDIGDGFKFDGIDPNMPASVIRSTSPGAQLLRANIRSQNASPRVSPVASPRASIELRANDEHTNNGHDLDAILLEDRNHLTFDSNVAQDGLSRFSSRSPTNSAIDNRLSFDDIADMQPLLKTSTSNSSTSNPFTNIPYGSDLNASRDSLSRRESSSVDITALYSKRTPFVRKFSTSATPILSALDSLRIDEETDENRNKSEDSLVTGNSFTSTNLTTNNGNSRDDLLLKQINDGIGADSNINNGVLNTISENVS
ncbi:hypothetical protein WICMUC_002297 [Wickerhamomyces mucosus]|uniref:Arrestin C-terminal-like domain-containing protein n=1 Tax=Wickerhamomyces mucosus TaxID=1378264 RepID=A0A9P8PPU1_9ASCO|nr:hypothetical protein WICMUC_002297 [Wickerhamomyces mucosus]